MSYPHRGGGYQRQNDSELPPPLIRPPQGYQAPSGSGPLPGYNSQPTLARGGGGPGASSSARGGTYGSAPVRRQTVRGAVRGTIREAGAPLPARPQSMMPQRALTRGKTLTRPDRFVAPAPLINPSTAKGGTYATTLVNGVPTLQEKASAWDLWGFTVSALTIWAPAWLLTSVGFTDPLKQRAWKEKCALCMIILVMMGVVAFLTIGLTKVLCPSSGNNSAGTFVRMGSEAGLIGVRGWNFNTTSSTSSSILSTATTLGGSDITDLFNQAALTHPSCTNTTAAYVKTDLCSTSASNTTCTYGALTSTLLASLGLTNTSKIVGYDWDQVGNYTNYFVIDGNVLNMDPYMAANPTAISSDPVDTAIRFMLRTMSTTGGKDGTRIFYNRQDLKAAVPCLVERYYAGHIDKVTPGCMVSQIFLYTSLCMIMGIILARFVMAFFFRWYLSGKLIEEPKNLKRHVISPGVMPEGANIDVDNTTGAAPWVNQAAKKGGRLRKNAKGGKSDPEKIDRSPALGADGMISMASIGAELFCVTLVTCYSEGAEGITATLDSIAATDYSDARKLIFVVCDGMITGGGESQSTPDICVGLLEADPRFGEPQPMSYVAIGDGSKAHNQAMVYAGHYTRVPGRRTPTLVIVKCGPPEEAKDKKPGNRGKRDSQMILMNFFSRVTYNDRMSPLDYDLFRKTQALMGVTPDFFEVCLMVDADTKVFPDSMGHLVRVMQNDNMVMGVCGETRIANKRQSWVTAIQVFEYFISHHQSKAFEACFGGVTCLPGCFSMYRLKARKADDGDWFPVLVQPQIVSQYSQSVVTTLHQKNLLLLGEDRFLTTLLIRTFPNRKMLFCPQARCRTIAPDTFAVLLSQRRRWINSTIHNLMELVLVPNLCGTFCFSMQFVVFIDLVGTLVLPAAICLTITTIAEFIITPPSNFSDAIPLFLLGAVLGLPGVLILITTFKVVYVGWMFIYLLALPVWNFVLPLYSFTKFDDFSWGATRVVAGEVRGEDGHGKSDGLVAQDVPLRRWEDWERSRLRKIKREQKRKQEFERTFGTKAYHGTSRDGISSYADSTAPSDTASLFSTSDESDRWGLQIGAYSEDQPSAAAPPVGLYNVDEESEGHETIDAHEMELVLEQGWADEAQSPSPLTGQAGYSNIGYGSPPPNGPAHRFYSLTDGSPSAPLMETSFSNSSAHLDSSTSSLHSGFGENPFANPRSPSPTASNYPLAGGIYQSESRLPLNPSAGVEVHLGHAKRRSLSGGGDPLSPSLSPSPSSSRDRYR
ncbi:chitin synthase, glycosyltransferase family 2 protein [Pseudohyphozyma bogoriensis]|nr:chitin synthase, glycosyltransferase family 2 protein [Pseudohyphozyma bogoriensis]